MAKVARAEKLLGGVDREITAYVQRRPYVGETYLTTEPTGYVVYAKLREDVPAVIALALGDFVHNLRSSLDHAARALVLANGGTPVDKGPVGMKRKTGRLTAFPILDVQPPQGGVSVAGGVAAGALAVIERAQPYNAKSLAGHPLLILDLLDNIDKHRALNVTSAAVTLAQTMFHFPESGTLLGGQLRRGRLDDGAVVAWLPVAGVTADTQVNVDPKLGTEVFVEDPIRDGEWLPIRETVRALRGYVLAQLFMLGKFAV